MKKFLSLLQISLVLSLANPFITNARDLTWTGAASGNWNDSANFSPMFVPTANDTVTIDAGTNHPQLTAHVTLYRLVLLDDTFDLNGYQLNVANEALFSGGWLVDGSLECRGTIATFAGTVINAAVDVDCTTLELNGSVFNLSCYFKAEMGESRGGNEFYAPVSLIHDGSGGESISLALENGDTFHDTLYVTNNSDGNIHLTQADTSHFKNCVRISSTGTGSIHFGREGGISILETNGHLVVENGEFTVGQLFLKNIEQQNAAGHRMVLTGTGSSDGHSLLAVDNCHFTGEVDFTAPNLLLSINRFDGDALFTKTGGYDNVSTGDNLFSGDASFTNSSATGHLLLTGSREDRFLGTAQYTSGSMRVISGYGATTIFEGDVVVNSATVGFYRLKFTGEAEQALSGTTGHLYGETELDKASASVTATIPIAIDRRLTFTKGYLVTDSVNLITFLAGATASGATDSSFVSGPVKKVGNTSFEFPVGKDGHFAPISTVASSYTTNAYTAEFFNFGQNFSNILDTTLNKLSTCSYWSLGKSLYAENIKVSIRFDTSLCHPLYYPNSWVVASLSDSIWLNKGRDSISGNYYSIILYSEDSISEFQYLTWGIERLVVADCNLPVVFDPVNCTLQFICNGGMEQGLPGSNNPNYQLFLNSLNPSGSEVINWEDINLPAFGVGGSADLYIRGNLPPTLPGMFGIPHNFHTNYGLNLPFTSSNCVPNGLDTHTGVGTGNDRYIGFHNGDAVVTNLINELLPGVTYELSFWAHVNGCWITPPNYPNSLTRDLVVRLCTDIDDPLPIYFPLPNNIHVSTTLGNNWWQFHTVNFTVPAGSLTYQNLIISGLPTTENLYFFIDDVSLITTQIASFTHDPACINQPVQFTCAVNDPAAQFQWSFGDGSTDNTQSPQHTYTEPGYYEVVLTVSIGNCVDCFRRVIYISPSCCAVDPAVVTYLDQTQVPDVITTNTTWNTNMFSPLPFRLNRTITVAPDATLTIAASAVIEFGPEGRIVVDRRDVNNSNVGGRMIMETNSKLTSITNTITNCPVMWQGVEVWGHHDISHFPTNNQVNHGMLTMLGEPIIEHAHNGVILGRTQYPFGDACHPPIDDVDYPPYDLTHSGGILIADAGARFFNNGIGVKFLPYRFNNASIIERSHFIGGTLLDAHYDSDNNPHYSLSVQPNHNPWYGEANPRGRSSIGIYNWGTRGLTFSLNSFENSQAGVESFDAQYRVDDHNNFYDHQYGIDVHNTISSPFTSVGINNGNTFMNIFESTVIWPCYDTKGDNAGIRIRGGRGDRIGGLNTFGNSTFPIVTPEPLFFHGIQLFGCDLTHIVDNQFGDLAVGIRTHGSFITSGLIGYETIGNFFNHIRFAGVLSLDDNPSMIVRCNTWNTEPQNCGYVCWRNHGSLPQWQGMPGSNHKNPAGNEWNRHQPISDRRIYHHLYNAIGIQTGSPYQYFHHTPSPNFLSVIPMVLSPQTIALTQSIASKTPTSCEVIPQSYLSVESDIDSLDGINDSLIDLKTELYLNLDHQNTSGILSYIADSNYTSAVLADSLVANSPLSDTVLLGLFQRPWPVGDSDLFEVMVHNLPVSDSLYDMFTERISSFSDTTLADSLLSLYVNNPFYHTVYGIEREVKVNRVSRNGLFGQVIDHYIENDSITELIIFMAGQSEISYKMDAFSTALVYGNLNLAHEIFTNLEPESETDQYWAQISGIALQLADSGLTWFSMDSVMEGTVMNIAQIEPECTAKRNAQSVLRLVRGLDFIEPAIMGDSIGARVAPSLSNQVSAPGMNKGELFINNEIIIYPNPIISGQLHIEFRKSPGTGNLKISDLAGKIVKEWVMPENRLNVDLNIQNLKSGIYFVLFDNDQQHMRAKFIISKP